MWTHHPAGGFLQAFSVIHSIRDCALALATDPKNHFLVTGKKGMHLISTTLFIYYKITFCM